MVLQELKDQIIFTIGDEFGIKFDYDVLDCKTIWDVISVLGKYGYDKQGSLDIIFSILIKQ